MHEFIQSKNLFKYTEDVLTVSCIGTVAQSSLWDIHVINMFTYEEGVGDYF